jgi:PPOX class probable F420-dependent enzyme
MTAIPDEVRARLEAVNFWHLATLNPDGSPQVTPMWVHVQGDHVVLNTAIGRVKHRNLLRDPRLSLAMTDPDNPYSQTEIRGRVAQWIEGDEGEAGIDQLAKKYIGKDVYPWRAPGERRVKILVEPTQIRHQAP